MSWRTRHSGKADNDIVTEGFLREREQRAMNGGFPCPRWIEFCRTLLDEGYDLRLYEARNTYSKYITVARPGDARRFKVRFSNHRPAKFREEAGDCDYIVGPSHAGKRPTEAGLAAVRNHFA